MLFNIENIPEWKVQSIDIKKLATSALHFAFTNLENPILLICVSQQKAFFNQAHLKLVQRIAPVTENALQTMYLNQQLQQETAERQRFEEYASFQAGIAEMSTSIMHNIGNAITGFLGSEIKIENGLGFIAEIREIILNAKEASIQEKKTLEWHYNLLQHIADALVDPQGTKKIQDGLDGIKAGSKHIAEIISIQQNSANPTVQSTTFYTQTLLDDILIMFEEKLNQHQIKVTTSIDDKVQSLHLPKNQLLQAILNLVKNSIEAIDERLNRKPEPHGSISIDLLNHEENLVKIIVQDNGCGLEKDNINNVFTFGYSSKKRGSGYGLHSVGNFVNSIGGSIDLTSDGLDQGCCFTIILPIK